MEKRAFTPLHPESPSFQTEDEWHIKLESTEKPRLLGRGVTGFTLLEVLVSAVIVSVVMLGLANIFISGKTYIHSSRLRMAGGELGRTFMDPLQMDVNQTTWGTNNNCLTNGLNCPGAITIPPGGTQYAPDYSNRTPNYLGTTLTRVVVTITWQEQ